MRTVLIFPHLPASSSSLAPLLPPPPAPPPAGDAFAAVAVSLGSAPSSSSVAVDPAAAAAASTALSEGRIPTPRTFKFRAGATLPAISTGGHSGGGTSRSRPAAAAAGVRSPADLGYEVDRRVTYEDFTTIDWIHDFTKDRLRAHALRVPGWRGSLLRAYSASQAWVIVFVGRTCTGWIAGVIDVASSWLGDIKEGYCSAGVYLNRKFCCCHRPGALFATCAAALVKTYAPYAAGEGVPEIKTILGAERPVADVVEPCVPVYVQIKCVGLVFAVGSGLSLGKEGPLVHVACCLGKIVPRIFDKVESNEARKREILVRSQWVLVAEISYYFPFKTMWRSFFCAMIGAISLKLVNPFRTDKL
ncbi:hypothetical protein HK405_006793, partial [Cladochytrium tenue]